MRHGFKAQAERSAASARAALGLRPHAPLDPWSYADYLKVTILEFSRLGLRAQTVRQLTIVDGDSWSAMTLKIGETFAIVLNPSHAITRQRSDLAHELSHIELHHVPARVEVSETGLLLLSDFSDEQEQEADWHGGALLLPRDGLVRMRSDRKSTAEIATYYGVSTALCEWRLRMTGVDVQIRRTNPHR
ncbi:MAG TPA: ImmA/IrrE family metallo-endopeptidase [Terriglobales bacterium]|nr:ImmA/IrrE family metallo-endopeptidase [Terriglobales bacterium]